MPWYEHIVDHELERMLTLARAKAALQTNPTLANLVGSMFGGVDQAAEAMNNFLRAYAGLDVAPQVAMATGPGPLKIHRLRRLACRELMNQHPELTRDACVAKIAGITDEQVCGIVNDEMLKDGEVGLMRNVNADPESWLTTIWHWIIDHLPQILFGLLGFLLL